MDLGLFLVKQDWDINADISCAPKQIYGRHFEMEDNLLLMVEDDHTPTEIGNKAN